MKSEKRYPKGHFIGIGLAIGIPLGVPIGLALGNIAIGPAMGVPIGLLIGSAMEKMFNKNPIELSDKEKAKQKKLLWITASAGLIVLIIGLELYFQVK